MRRIQFPTNKSSKKMRKIIFKKNNQKEQTPPIP